MAAHKLAETLQTIRRLQPIHNIDIHAPYRRFTASHRLCDIIPLATVGQDSGSDACVLHSGVVLAHWGCGEWVLRPGHRCPYVDGCS